MVNIRIMIGFRCVNIQTGAVASILVTICDKTSFLITISKVIDLLKVIKLCCMQNKKPYKYFFLKKWILIVFDILRLIIFDSVTLKCISDNVTLRRQFAVKRALKLAFHSVKVINSPVLCLLELHHSSCILPNNTWIRWPKTDRQVLPILNTVNARLSLFSSFSVQSVNASFNRMDHPTLSRSLMACPIRPFVTAILEMCVNVLFFFSMN